MVSKEVACVRGQLSKELAEERLGPGRKDSRGKTPRQLCEGSVAGAVGRMKDEARSDRALEGRERSLHFIPVTWKASGAVETRAGLM